MTTIVEKLSYDQKEIIGRGGNGTTVFKGFYYEDPTIHGGTDSDEEKTKQVAIKRIQRSYVEGDESIIKHEVDLMLKVGNHPNILRYIHSEMDINYLYIATELCRGTIEDFFNGKHDGLKKEIITKKEILRQVTKGLAHLHKLGIVHRDIKPTNILIFELHSEAFCNKPQIRLADFDISKILKPGRRNFTNTSVTNPSGTWGWIAPELYEEDRFDFKVDVWALGCIFGYTLSGGKHPFGDDNILKRIDRIKQKRGILLTKKDLLLENQEKTKVIELVKSMLMSDPKIRPTVMDVLKGSFLRDEERTAEFLGLCKSFHDSITSDKINLFEKLLKEETIDVDTKSEDGSTPLHYLCKYYTEDNLLHFVELLIQNGADVNAKNVSERIPLYGLCHFYDNSNLIHVVKLLLEKGVQANVRDRLGNSPLSLLCSRYNKDNMLDIVKLLVYNGADVNNKSNFMLDFIGVGENPLCLLCGNYSNENLIDIIQFLIDQGADVNAKDEDGNSPLHKLCYFYQKGNLQDIVQLLIQHGAFVNAKSGFTGTTPLHAMCLDYKKRSVRLIIEIVHLLIESGAKVNTKDDRGMTPLHSLFFENEKGNLDDIVQLLVEKGADVNAKSSCGWNPLHVLCYYYKNDKLKDIIQLLVEKGADVNAKNDNGNTPLHYLCIKYKRSNVMEIIKLLIKKGARVNVKNVSGNTPLHYLCYNYSNFERFKKDYVISLINFLVEKGAKLNEKNGDGETPYDILSEEGL